MKRIKYIDCIMTTPLQQLEAAIQNDAASRAFVRSLRWHEGFRCPDCGHQEGHEVVDGRFWACSAHGCRYRSCLRVGTFLEGSRKPIRLWLMALFAFLRADKGITAPQLVDELNGRITLPTAWDWLRRFRLVLHTDTRLRCFSFQLRPKKRQKTHACAGPPSHRSAISWVRSGRLLGKKADAFSDWLLDVYVGRVSSKYLESYWLEFQFRAACTPVLRPKRFFECVRRGGGS